MALISLTTVQLPPVSVQYSTTTPCSSTLMKTFVSEHDCTTVQYYTVLFSTVQLPRIPVE